MLKSLMSWFKKLFTHTKEENAHKLALSNFVYEADKVNEYRIYDYIDKPFHGDCEDFAFTLQRQIGGDV